MAQAMLKDIGGIIVRTPGNCGGRPRIDGRRVEVRAIVAYHHAGESPEEIADNFSDLDLAYVYAALAYYYVNKKTLDREFVKLEKEEAALEREYLAALEPVR